MKLLWQEYKYKAIHGDIDSSLPSNWPRLREKAKSLFYTQQGEHTIYEIRQDGTKYAATYVFDAFTGRIYQKDADGWQLHHVDHDENNNEWDNFLWVMKLKDPDTGESSHRTVFATDQERREYIALGKMIKIAFKYGYAPRIWSYSRQAYYYEILRKYPRRFISNY